MGKQKEKAGPQIGGGKGGNDMNIEIREGAVALLRFKTRDGMNKMLDPLSNAIEGSISNRLGHNFILSEKVASHVALRKSCNIPKQVKYLIGTLDGDAHSIRHEMCHARFYLDPDYKVLVGEVWSNKLADSQRNLITGFLNRLKYDSCVHIDEFQAYLVTEKSNFFGIDLSDLQDDLSHSFPPGSWR
uniref:Uncharacterized protein n=1 Tax=Polytomella parva TaxID=51329 RepID=A0A7S0YB42_9CHLO|mmetsp:Transcript_19632/g.35400  ORF Transcript_19632/g.35400 Transcript_19632/m.35400 type:complete len:187 (+) Transcript_19632:111-671(+)